MPRREFLYDMQYWEVLRIIRGYRRRERTSHILTRLQTFWMVKTSMAKTEKIREPSDLWKLPWDDEDVDEAPISKEEQADLSNLIMALNSKETED